MLIGAEWLVALDSNRPADRLDDSSIAGRAVVNIYATIAGVLYRCATDANRPSRLRKEIDSACGAAHRWAAEIVLNNKCTVISGYRTKIDKRSGNEKRARAPIDLDQWTVHDIDRAPVNELK